jgi:hypothetical protein
MPRNLPIGTGCFVEEDSADGKGLAAKDGCNDLPDKVGMRQLVDIGTDIEKISNGEDAASAKDRFALAQILKIRNEFQRLLGTQHVGNDRKTVFEDLFPEWRGDRHGYCRRDRRAEIYLVVVSAATGTSISDLRMIRLVAFRVASSKPWPWVMASVGQASTQ